MNSLPLNRQRLSSANDPHQRPIQGNSKRFPNAFPPTCTDRCIDTPSTSGTDSGYTGDVGTESGTDSYYTPDVSLGSGRSGDRYGSGYSTDSNSRNRCYGRDSGHRRR